MASTPVSNPGGGLSADAVLAPRGCGGGGVRGGNPGGGGYVPARLIGCGAQGQLQDGAMALVLDLDPAALGEAVAAEALVEHRARRAQGAVEGGDVVRAALADGVNRFTAVAGDVEIITRHRGLNAPARNPGARARSGLDKGRERRQGAPALPNPGVPVDFVSILSIFVLACFVGYYVVWSVTPALHTPLMSVTNAISSVIIVGALIAAAAAGVPGAKWLGLAAVVLASINIFGGFAVTARMLAMYKKKEKKG